MPGRQVKSNSVRAGAAATYASVELADDAKPELLQRYLDRWFWEVKGHVGGLTPNRPTTNCGPPRRTIPVFELTS